MSLFTSDEIVILKNSTFLLTKQQIASKITGYLEELASDLEKVLISSGIKDSVHYHSEPFKVSKGENYKGLPYFILDYPRNFKLESIFSFRTMIWWGREISCSLIISGSQLNHFKPSILLNLPKEEFYFCINDDPWEHHFGASNYLPIREVNLDAIKAQIERNAFIKISDKIEISQIHEIKPFAQESLARFLRCLL